MSTTTNTEIRVGDRLKNGATVLAIDGFMPAVPGLKAAAIVLCLSHREFVTWQINTEDGETYWGHYHHDDLSKAFTDFNERVARCHRVMGR